MTGEESAKKILIVDDSTSFRKIISGHLAHLGYEIITAENGHDGFKMFKKLKPDLVISDVNMPVWNGFDLCKIIKFDPNYDNTPVALITSSVNQEFLIRSIAVGADLFLTRPYQETVLQSQVKTLLEKGGWKPNKAKVEVIEFEGESYEVPTDWKHLSAIMLNAYLAVTHQNTLLQRLSGDLQRTSNELLHSKNEIHKILSNTLPEKIVETLTNNGHVDPEMHDDVTVMFTDFVGFTKSVELMPPQQLIKNLNYYFEHFDDAVQRYGLEKIKTIGDSYMMASGVPEPSSYHALRCLLTGLELLDLTLKVNEANNGIFYWPMRIGINTGPVVAGIIGKKKFAYDLWGANVNIASRLESFAESNSIFISETTLELVEPFITYSEFHHNFAIPVRMFKVKRLKPEFSSDARGFLPNQKIINFLQKPSSV